MPQLAFGHNPDLINVRSAGYLLLEDGRRFDGERVGAESTAFGEAVFNTSMTGYQEVLTDPSYAGQIVAMTYPQIGNYGTNDEDAESGAVQVAGFVMREIAERFSNWRGDIDLDTYLRRSGTAGLTGVDTRALTRHLRSAGAMRAAIAGADVAESALLEQVRSQPRMEGLDLTGEVSTEQPYETPAVGVELYRIVAYDFGVKRRSIELLAERGCHVTTLPAGATADEIEALEPDGFFLSNGPGDPEAVAHALEAIRRLAGAGTPVFGICLGHQLLARAFGASTFKLLYGHRAGNHPVLRLEDGAVEITAQNHGFAVRRGEGDAIEGAPALRATHMNLNDQTLEGLEHRELSAFSVQYHPEAAPGPHDSVYLFDRFIAAMRRTQDNA